MGKDSGQIKREIEDTRERMSATADAIGYRADVPSRMRENISDKVDDVKNSIGDQVDNVRESVQATASDLTRRGGDLANGMIENPLGMALGGLALGLLIGMSIPVTDFERERLGPLADQLKDTVKEKGQDAFERGKDVLQQAASAAVAEVSSAQNGGGNQNGGSQYGGTQSSGATRQNQSSLYTSESEASSPAPVTE